MPSKPVNVKQVIVFLRHEQHAKLQALKARTGAPVSEHVRRAVDAYLKKESRR